MKFRLKFTSRADLDIEYLEDHLRNFSKYKISEREIGTGYSIFYIEIKSLRELVEFERIEGRIILDGDVLVVFDEDEYDPNWI